MGGVKKMQFQCIMAKEISGIDITDAQLKSIPFTAHSLFSFFSTLMRCHGHNIYIPIHVVYAIKRHSI